MLPTFNKTPKGFTLIELMVTISIVAILAAIGVTVYSSAQNTAKDAKIKEDMEDIKKAMYVIQTATGSFCLGVPCGFSIWVNTSAYAASSDPGKAVAALKPYLKQQTVFTPPIGLRVQSSDVFYLFSSLTTPPTTSCSQLDMWDDWYFTGTGYSINYCISN